MAYNFYIINDDGTYTPICDNGQIQTLNDETILAINEDWAFTSPANKITDAVLSADSIFYHNYYGDFADLAYRRFYDSGLQMRRFTMPYIMSQIRTSRRTYM